MVENIVNITYAQTGKATNTNELGMRPMQAKAYEARNKQYILLKAPPASGKSRALMFLALDKIHYQSIRKVIVAVPEKTIGRSFANTDLAKYGFFTDWRVARYFNLCDAENEQSKVKRFVEFTTNTQADILVCTHATLRYAAKELGNEAFNDCLLAIDEFHHVSADANSGLGDIVHRVMTQTNAHIIAMTGSYFRGDGVPVLRSDDENRFYPVTYNYYEQLNGYRYLKSLGIGYHFYQGSYLTAIMEVLDPEKKTIIHIPSVNSRASTGDKYDEVKQIIDRIGETIHIDYETRIYTVCTPDNRTLKIADLVEDDPRERMQLQAFLQRMNSRDAVDIIIALGTAKEGFDWQWCEHCLTIGVRGSLTEVVQIIGRCTRDCEGKSHAQFTNLIACPDAVQQKVETAVNDMLKAITVSLLMEQVMAPSWNFKTKKDEESDNQDTPGIYVEGLKPISTERTQEIVTGDLTDLKAIILQDDMIVRSMGGGIAPEVINQVLIPKIIQEKYPELSPDEVEEVRQHLVLDAVTKGANLEQSAGNTFMVIGRRFINIDNLSINLIDTINPFQRGYEILSKSVTAPVLKVVQNVIEESKIDMLLEEAVTLYRNYLPQYMNDHHGAEPELTDPNPFNKRLAQALAMLRKEKQKLLDKNR
ncbi:MAG: DEAD/DEAH box helicase [Bacteroidales bacterium]|nr:DEAD/DEAH box helicase [Bacteroidales bacterium]